MSLVLPGDVIPSAVHPNLKLGPGLVHVFKDGRGTAVVSTKGGTVQHTSNNKSWWVESNSKRYVPAPQESVIGIVTGKSGTDGFRVDIGSAHQASLDAMAFESATKRNRPNFKVNTLVYARVSQAHKDMEPELECFDAQTRKAEDYGELKGGFCVKCSLGHCRSLLDPKHYLLKMLGSKFGLEVIVGVNGRVWFKAAGAKEMIAVARCIEAADSEGGRMNEEETRKFFESMDL